ncbi:MAG: aspartate aminotransferase family protein [Chitinophagaceae bacterium]|nr:aspartate aminotransferase family protein [Chitinophagaceae bacterium]
MNQRELFLKHVAQTSIAPMALEIVKAEGVKLYDKAGKEYTDLIGGISVANIGHRHPKVLHAIKSQLEDYMHIMVYGEFVETPQVQYAMKLTQHLPGSLNAVYFTNSGSEATEGAMKLAKRVTGRTNMVGFKNSYHGSTQGALSMIGDEYWRNAFRPLIPGIVHLDHNSFEALDHINEDTACVLLEPIQAEAGLKIPSKEWMQAIRNKCTETGTLLILDEIQTGFGRTGKLWAFELFDIVPDILLLGKALGGGMPLGAFIADKKLMDAFSDNPVLGHISTFAGHPVCCAAGLAAFEVLLEENIIKTSMPALPEITSGCLYFPFPRWGCIGFDSFETNKKVIDRCLEKGLVTDWFLFASSCLRISPPLTMTDDELFESLEIVGSIK